MGKKIAWLPHGRLISSAVITLSVIVLSSCGQDTGQEGSAADKPGQTVTQSESTVVPYLDVNLDSDSRVDDLVNRMTLEEKISQMRYEAPAIERLGIPEYNWWSEALHGVARAGLATVFPQAIGLAATWDEKLMFRVATAISDEARAKHHDFAARGNRNIYQGLTLWSPNINIFRDPRWGRGQETYGEDPWLTGRMAVQFIKGLQGDDPRYLKTVATVKHYAVHNGPEPERHEFDAVINRKDLWETYLPQFEMGIQEGGAYSLMCAYNRINGDAACANDLLTNDILRGRWGFDGYIVSDCWAINDFHAHHKVTQTPQESAALAVKLGTDLNCGDTYPSLGVAVAEGLITEEEIDVSVKRLFVARMKLGMFDPDEMVEYARIPYSVVNSQEHQGLALQAAQESIVLLKNDGNILPLSKDIGSIAVIGPNSDDWLMLLGNYNGIPADPVTPLQGIRDAVSPETEVTYAQGSELAAGFPLITPVPSSFLFTAENGDGLTADFYGNSDLEGTALYSEVHPNVDVNWSDGAPREDMDDDNFGVRWTGELVPEISGQYRLGLRSTLKAVLKFEGEPIVDTEFRFRAENPGMGLKISEGMELQAGKRYSIEIMAGETQGDAQIQLVWDAPRPQLEEDAVKVASAADAVVMFMGLTAEMEGEEMNIDLDGFRGGDRTKLGLPKNQLDLIKKIHALGKPVVLVLLNGSALAVNWENENIPAIIEAWYPGQAGGTAIANVLFGDYNPGGKLPVTYYRSVDDLPPFEDYNMTTQTYRYFAGEPLYPFGYGLSYTSFTFSGIEVPASAKAGEPVTISATIRNTGQQAGDEVVQVYVSRKEADFVVPIRSLRAFERMTLQAGEERKLSFELNADAFAVISDAGEKLFPPGSYEVSVGGGQPDVSIDTSSNVLTAIIQIE